MIRAASALASAVVLALPAPGRAADYDSSHDIPGYLYGSAFISAGKWRVTDAMGRIDRELAHDPHNGNLHFQRGTTLMQQGYPAAALSEFRIVMRMRPNAAHLHVTPAWALLIQGQTEASVLEFGEALKMKRPLNAPVTYGLLSLALEKQHAYGEAATALSSALAASSPDYEWEFLDVRCNVAAQIGLLAAAGEACDQTIAQHPRDAYAFEGRGLLDLQRRSI